MSLHLTRKTKWIAIAGICVIVLCVLLWPGLLWKWTDYNLSMLRRTWNNVFPFFFINLGLAALVCVIELFAVGYRRSTLRQLLHPDKSIVSDIWITLVNTLSIDYILVYLLTLGVMNKMKIGTGAALGMDSGLLATSIQSPAIQVIIYVLFIDLLLYVQHYIHHRIPFFWSFHSFHHSASELNILTANRGHPVQSEVTYELIAIIPMVFVGVPLVSMLWFRVCKNLIGFMSHSRLPWKWGWIGKYVVVSPAYHRVHHSVLPEHYDRNLAVLFPVWDHLFGTYYQGTRPAVEVGLPNNQYNRKSFADDMMVPFRMLKKR